MLVSHFLNQLVPVALSSFAKGQSHDVYIDRYVHRYTYCDDGRRKSAFIITQYHAGTLLPTMVTRGTSPSSWKGVRLGGFRQLKLKLEALCAMVVSESNGTAPIIAEVHVLVQPFRDQVPCVVGSTRSLICQSGPEESRKHIEVQSSPFIRTCSHVCKVCISMHHFCVAGGTFPILRNGMASLFRSTFWTPRPSRPHMKKHWHSLGRASLDLLPHTLVQCLKPLRRWNQGHGLQWCRRSYVRQLLVCSSI